MVQLPAEARGQGGRAPAGFSINHEGEVEQGVVEHRHQTRQRHLSSGQDEDIASSYFAAQYGGQQKAQQPQQQGRRQGSQGGSRRGSVGLAAASNTGVQSVMANAAAAIAARKQQEQEARQEEARRLLQRREMTPDNLRHVEEKLIELQRQRQQEAEQERERTARQAEQGLPPEGSLPPPPPRPEPYTGRGSVQGPEQKEARAGGQRTQSVDREAVNGKWAISASTDYLNKKSDNSGLGMVRSSAPLGLAEPSVKRDGYAVGSKEGSMYRSTGNLNVSSGVAGSRAGSESKDQPRGSWKERRASTSDIKGSGIRTGGNLVEPSAKPCMPFGSGGGGNQVRRQQSGRRQVTKSSQQQQSSSRSSSTCRTSSSTCSTMQQVSTALEQIQVQESRAQVTVALPRGPRSRAQSLPRGQVTNEESSFKVSLPASARTSRQASAEPEGRKKLTRHGSVEIYDGSYKLTVPSQLSRQASQTKLEQTKGDHIRIEAGEEEREASPAAVPAVQQTYAGPTTVEQTYTAPAPAHPAVQQSSVQQSSVKESVQQSSVQQTSVQQTSVQQSVQQTSMHQEETSFQQSTSVQEFSEQTSSQQSSVQQSSVQHQQSSVQHQQSSMEQSSKQMSSTSQSSIQQSSAKQSSNEQSSMQKSSVQQSSIQQTSNQLSSIQQNSNQQSSIQQSSSQQSSIQQNSNQQASIQQSTKESSVQQQSSMQQQSSVLESRDPVPQAGGKFNITQGLTRRSRQPSGSQQEKSRSRQPSGQAAVAAAGPGAALRGLDTALQQIAAQQQKETTNTGTTYIAKVSSRQSSRHPSGSGDVTSVTLSLPPSQRGSRQTSRRGSVSEGGDRRARRGSLDIYTAEYALKIGTGERKGITAMEQKTAFHMKVENEAESDMTLCGRCHLPTHKTKACPEFGSLHCPRCLDWAHWEDSCWAGQTAQLHPCSRCQYEGHTEAVHDTQDYFQRRAVVDALGWEPFQDWFYEAAFRSWWQVTGCVGVPLYRLYPRKTAWRTERPEEPEEQVARSSLARADSVDDMIAQVKLLSQRRPPPRKEESDSSGRSTPAHLREDPSSGRTFSESLQSMEAEVEAK